ncbi:protein takeout-like [Planococcus citri]|uniref:protein takeout-like n=1 Tax=Planococcus citri TaxID=170843 RepID=UPI0031F8A8BF
MNSVFLVVYICGFLSYLEANPVKLPKGFIQCKQSDPQFDQCVTKAVNEAVPELVKGVPRFGLPPIDPLRISTLSIDQGHGPVAIKMDFNDLDIVNIGTADVKDVKVDMGKKAINMKLDLSAPVILEGHYKVSGKVLVLPIQGDGRSKFTLSGFKAEATCNFKETTKDGETFWSLDNMDFNFSVTKLHIIMENLFNGDKALGDNMNVFLNENWPEILGELRGAFRTAFASAFSEIAQRFFEKVPIEQVFPK